MDDFHPLFTLFFGSVRSFGVFIGGEFSERMFTLKSKSSRSNTFLNSLFLSLNLDLAAPAAGVDF